MSDKKDEKKLELKGAFAMAAAGAREAVNGFVDAIKTNWESECPGSKIVAVVLAGIAPVGVPLSAGVGAIFGSLQALKKRYSDLGDHGRGPQL
ncbi:MAG TPA: hypothetical protein VIG74_01455 [Alphaproteobacteria bacterium]|jgi:hypothetical protein